MAEAKPSLGYSDTPIIPGQKWHVHDGDRPQPRVITPPTESTQDKPGKPSSDAVVLFDGSSLAPWQGRDGATKWKLENGYMEVVPGTGNIYSTEKFGSCQLHVEFAEPTVIKGAGQGRGNSGVFLMRMYEIQVLDCYNNPTYPDGTTAGIYGQYPPLVNACRAPGQWQSYDIIWEAPKFEAGKLVKPAFVTVMHNGLVVHHRQELQGPTQHRQLASYTPHDPVGSLELQDHGDLVRYRNIWYRPLRSYDE